MKIFITGICGFVGSALAEALLEFREGISIFAVDNLQRPGSEMNRGSLRSLSLRVVHGDIRMASDSRACHPPIGSSTPPANPSVLAGVSGNGNSSSSSTTSLAS
jgi:CDP-paratose 2-epimerase